MEVATGKPAAPEPKPGSTQRQGTPTLPRRRDQENVYDLSGEGGSATPELETKKRQEHANPAPFQCKN